MCLQRVNGNYSTRPWISSPFLVNSPGFGTISSYIIAICHQDVEPVLPSVSKTAAFEPQGSIFNQFLDTVAFVGLMTVFVRFLQVEMASTSVKESNAGLIYRLRVASLTFGIGSMIGVSIAGNFRFPKGEVS